jgi:hypothetical protein
MLPRDQCAPGVEALPEDMDVNASSSIIVEYEYANHLTEYHSLAIYSTADFWYRVA